VFVLRGSDVYRVTALERITPGRPVFPPPQRCAHYLGALRRASQRLAAATDLHALLDETLAALADAFGYEHAMILLLDRRADRLFTVASRGYPSSGAGSEVPMGAGLIGVCARERAPLRVNHLSAEYSYLRAVRDSIERAGGLDGLETAIPLPGLSQPHSQLAVPIVAADALLGVVFVESPLPRRFGYDDEDALAALAAQLGATMPLLQSGVDLDADVAGTRVADPEPPADAPAPAPKPASRPDAPPVPLRRYAHDDSVFLGDDYLIKGVAGQVLWLMARDHVERGRTQFTNRELRLDPRLRLPDVCDNLEARLVLLQRRLADRDACIRLERAGRGRLRLDVACPLQLVEVR
jgi:putative methionine-R-sulfoxide reductase with GAF domain